jgi:hypothetical protein
VVSARVQVSRDRGADSRRCAGDESASHPSDS